MSSENVIPEPVAACGFAVTRDPKVACSCGQCHARRRVVAPVCPLCAPVVRAYANWKEAEASRLEAEVERFRVQNRKHHIWHGELQAEIARLREALAGPDWGEQYLREMDERKRQGDRAHKWQTRADVLKERVRFLERKLREIRNAHEPDDPIFMLAASAIAAASDPPSENVYRFDWRLCMHWVAAGYVAGTASGGEWFLMAYGVVVWAVALVLMCRHINRVQREVTDA